MSDLQCLVCYETVQHPERYWYELRAPYVPRFYLCDEHGDLVSRGAGWMTVDANGRNPRFVWRESLPVKDNPYTRHVKVHEVPLESK